MTRCWLLSLPAIMWQDCRAFGLLGWVKSKPSVAAHLSGRVIGKAVVLPSASVAEVSWSALLYP